MLAVVLLAACKRDNSTQTSSEDVYLADYEVPEDKWGFMDTIGNLVIEAKYDDVGPFSEGLAAVNLNGKWGYVDHSGAMVIQPIFRSAWAFHEGFARVTPFDQPALFIDKSGKPMLSEGWTAEDDFSNGRARVRVGTLFGYIDHTGKMVIQSIYTRGWNFQSGLCVVEYQDKLGVINQDGKDIIAAVFDKIKLSANHQYILTLKGNDGFVLDGNGTEIIHLPNAKLVDTDGETVSVREGNNMYLLNMKDHSKSNPYINIIFLEDNRWAGRSAEGYQLMDSKGLLVSSNSYQQINKFFEGIAAYSKGELWGYMNVDGAELTENVFGLAWDYKESLARAVFDEGIAFINKSQRIAFYPPQGSLDMRDFSEGLASVQVD